MGNILPNFWLKPHEIEKKYDLWAKRLCNAVLFECAALRCLKPSFVRFSCRWHGKPCDIENDFVTTLTDHGICYKFNFKEPSLKLSESGTTKL